jgi:uncharacterized protein (DUF1919 family)
MKMKDGLNRIREKVAAKWVASFPYRKINQLVSKKFQRRLTNKDFTILCSNCIGGVIYHRLGKQFLSPTINMYISQPDFISFCVHLDYYLNKELEFVQNGYGCPTAHLEGDGRDIPTITVLFIHEKEESVARKNWERRKARIRWDNLYIIMYKLDGVTVEELRQIEYVRCNNKVVLTATPLPEVSWSYYIKPNMHHSSPYSYLNKDIFGIRLFEKRFDFVSFLNCNSEGKKA